MSMENPMNNVKPDEVNKPTGEPTAKSAGEGREPERNFKIANERSEKLNHYTDIADLYGARAENLFKKNQERAKALGTKGWDKTSALYRHWFKTTQVVKLADKLANFYKQSDTASPAELSQAEIWEKEISNVRQELDLTREEAWDDSSAARELTDRWSGIKTPKQPSVESQAQGVITELKQAATEQDADTELAHQELKDRWAGMVAKPKKESIGKLISDISLAEGSVSKDQATLEARRDAEKIVADQLAMKKQIETARKEADRISAEQTEQAKVDAYEKSVSGPFGWFKRLFKSKEQKAVEAVAKEKTELIKAGVEADTALETKWTEADEKKQEKKFKPGLINRVEQASENLVVNAQAHLIDRKADKQIAREKIVTEKAKKAAADLEDWQPEVDESVAKRGLVDRALSHLDPNPEKQGEKIMKEMEKAEAKEAAMLKKAGAKADAALKRGWTEEDERKQQESIKGKGLWKRGLNARGNDKLEQALINRKAGAIDTAYDKQTQKEAAEAAKLEDWKEEIDESVAKRSWVDKALSKLTPNAEKQGEKMMRKLEKAEAKEASMLKKAGTKADAALKRGWTAEDEEKQMNQFKPRFWQKGLDKRGNDKLEQAVIDRKSRSIDTGLDNKEQMAELRDGLAHGREKLAEETFAEKMATRKAKRELKSNPVPAADSADIAEAE